MTHGVNRRTFLAVSGLSSLGVLSGFETHGQNASATDLKFPEFNVLGETFRFAICADPQLGPKDSTNSVFMNARRTLLETVQEINAMGTPPVFVVFLGDLVNVFNEASVAHFEECISALRAKAVLVHGNHDTHPPYDGFRGLMERVCGFRDVFYSFNAGQWHFIVLPCNLGGRQPEQTEVEAAMLAWLERDLETHKDRPTMVFEHLHALPQGLTQLEWYTFPLALRLKLMDLLTRHGNVRYYFNGHVHNGLKTSVKTAWRYRGITFITVPTIIQSRNFGEEFEPFQRGLDDGGYYLLVDIQGEDVVLTGCLAGEVKMFTYPGAFPEFQDAVEPRWFQRVTELPAAAALVNGNFTRGLAGWQPFQRYLADDAPGFGWEARDVAGRRAARLFTRAKAPEFWANDENTELYQVVALPEGAPVFHAAYYLDDPPRNGGGYVRLCGIRDAEFAFMMMFQWGENEEQSHILPRAFGYALHGEQQSWAFLQDLGAQRMGMYWDVPAAPGQWHELSVNLRALYDAVQGREGAFDDLGLTKVIVAIGTWTNRELGSESAASFGDIDLVTGEPGTASTVDGLSLATDAAVFTTRFGQELVDQTARKRERREQQDTSRK